MKFENLHAHDTFSSFDGFGYPEQLAEYLWQIGCKALSITNHGNMNSLVYQYQTQQNFRKVGKNIKNIYGVEAYFIPSIEEWRGLHKQSKNKKKKMVISSSYVEDEEKDFKAGLRSKRHLLLLAKNNNGLENLFQLVTKSFRRENFYYYPRIDFSLLKEHNEGLIASTACLGGIFGGIYYQNKDKSENEIIKLICETAEELTGVFGENWYGELQWNNLTDQHILNKLIIRASKECGFKLLTTTDVHYPEPKYWKCREVLKKLGFIGNIELNSIPDSIDKLQYWLYPRNGGQIWSLYKYVSQHLNVCYDDDIIAESIENSHIIAHSLVEDFNINTKIELPDFIVPKDVSADEEFKKACWERFNKLKLNDFYREKLQYEIDVITKNGYSGYFLIMKAISDKANKLMLTGCGRGSAGGALTSYVLGITQIDPLKYNLLFSRFMSEDQATIGYPDIDYDVSDPMKFKNKLIEEWGEYSVVPISNFNTLKLKSLIKDISRLYEIPFKESNEVTSVMEWEAMPYIKEKHGITAGVYTPTFDEVRTHSKSLRKYFKKYPQLAEYVENLYGQIKSCSRHAGGVLVSQNLDKKMPLINNRGIIQTPWGEGMNVHHLEPMGFIKFDILGLSTLAMIEQAVSNLLTRKKIENSFENIKAFYDEHLHPDHIDFNDERVWKHVFEDGNFVGIFQFTGKGAQNLCMRVKPKTIKELATITAIFRPGPLSANVHETYVAAKNNPEEVEYEHKIVKQILEDSYGHIIFQEDLALLANKMGKGISLDEANLMRKVYSKWMKDISATAGRKLAPEKQKIKDDIDDKFITGCIEKGMKMNVARELLNKIAYFSGYGFNKCLHKDTIVETKTGFKTIEDVNACEYVNSKNGFVRINYVYINGKKDLVKIMTKTGKELVCTLDHKIETESGMRPLKDILERKDEILIENGIFEKIIEMQPYGNDETYDIEVEHDDHSFYANGISVSNSHALSYSVISYQCAWLYYHYPIEWCAAFLDKESEKKKELAISLVKHSGIDIESFDINDSSAEIWKIKDDKTLIPPLTFIKGLGIKAIEQIMAHRPFNTIEEVLFNDKIAYNKFNKKAVGILAKSNSMKNLMDFRFKNNAHFYKCIAENRPKNAEALEKNILEFADIDDYDKNEYIQMLYDLTGIYPFELVVNKFVLEQLKDKYIQPIGQYDKDLEYVWFVTKGVQISKTKNNSHYYSLTVTDDSGAEFKVKCWNVNIEKNKMYPNRLYIAKDVHYDSQWGYSIRQIWKNVVIVN